MNDSDQLLSLFFSRGYENERNENLFLRSFKMDYGDVISYVQSLVQTPLPLFVNYIEDNCSPSYITYQDVVQYSSFSDATSGICKVLMDVDNNGLSNIEVGRALLNDGKERNNGALRKYGENHAKTAIELGLVHSLYGYNYLTCLGLVYSQLNILEQKEMLRRTVLRNRFIQKVITKSRCSQVVLFEELSFLSASTVKRRMPNIRYLFSLLIGNEPEMEYLLKKICL